MGDKPEINNSLPGKMVNISRWGNGNSTSPGMVITRLALLYYN